jgi:hypothetical protein
MKSYLKRISALLFYASSLLLCISINSCSKADDDQTDAGYHPELEIKDQLFIQIIDGGDTITHLSISDFTTHRDGYLAITSLTLGPAISIGAEVEVGDKESILDNDDDNFFVLTYEDQAFLTKYGGEVRLTYSDDGFDTIGSDRYAAALFTGNLVNNDNSKALEIRGYFHLPISL